MTMTLIATVAVSSNPTTLSSIPQTFSDLKIVGSLRSTAAQTWDTWYIRFNGNSSSLYTSYALYGTGSSADVNNGITPDTAVYFSNTLPAANVTANTFNNFEMYIPNYAGATNKSFAVDVVTENNATGSYQAITAGRWASTSAVTSITFGTTGSNFTTGSTISIYGILKGSGGATVA